MLKSLIEFFLLISSDKKTITQDNILTLHQFITKKIPEIENQRPSIISYSLYINNYKNNTDSLTNHKIESFSTQNENLINNHTNRSLTKNSTIKDFQNELISLFNDMIDYMYEENIIVLKEDKKEILYNKIKKKLLDNNIIIKNNSPNNTLVDNIQKNEIRNYILELIINNNNNFISFDISIKDFINFFNSKNKDKNRLIAYKFMNTINPIIKIYLNDKKFLHKKVINKSKAKSLSRIPIIHIDNSNIKMNIINDVKNVNKTNKKTNNYNHKVNNSYYYKKNVNQNLGNLVIKFKRKTEYKNRQNVSKKNIKEQINFTSDTIQCQTLNNSNSYDNIKKESGKDVSNNININNKNTNTKNIINNSNSKNLIINKLKKFDSNNQIDHFKKKKKIIKNKYKQISYNNNTNKKIYRNNRNKKIDNDLLPNNDDKKENQKSLVSTKSYRDEIISDNFNGCLVY